MDDFDRPMGRLSLVPEASAQPLALAAAWRLPHKDVPILASAIAAGTPFLVTGDRRDFGHLYGQVIEGVEIITPADALDKALALDPHQR